MKVSVFTGCQPRHVALIERLAGLADVVYASMEVNTLFPGRVEDFYKRSQVMQSYFERVMRAEKKEFGEARFLPPKVRVLPMKAGDLNMIEPSALREALDADLTVVFGASFIKKPLIGHLIDRRALNIHMGTSPYYRGSSCNFWALYDNRPDYVGATIHLLTEGLDSGPMLCHALPRLDEGEQLDGFELGMRAVRAASDTLASLITNSGLSNLEPIPQDKTLQRRYTRNADFTDEVAAEYLTRVPSPQAIKEAICGRDNSRFLLPISSLFPRSAQ